MTSLSTILPTPCRNAEGDGSHVVRATSPAKSRLTVRLPDLNTARAAFTSPIAGTPKSELAEATENGGAGQTEPEASSSAWLRPLARKTLDFVRQPKFWLAFVVAVAVQVVLAFVMTPAEGESDSEKSAPSVAQPWQKAAEEPAARIVVPAAPVSAADDHSDTAPAVTPPMGPALPFDATSGAAGHASDARTAEGAEEPAGAARLADKASPTAEGARVAGRPAAQSNGATLGGIAPLDADLPSEKHEIR